MARVVGGGARVAMEEKERGEWTSPIHVRFAHPHGQPSPNFAGSRFCGCFMHSAQHVGNSAACPRPPLPPQSNQWPAFIHSLTHPSPQADMMLAAARSSSLLLPRSLRPAGQHARFAAAAATGGWQKEYEFILAEKKDKVALLTLNRPKALNALCNGIIRDLLEVCLLVWVDASWQLCMVSCVGPCLVHICVHMPSNLTPPPPPHCVSLLPLHATFHCNRQRPTLPRTRAWAPSC